MNYDPGYAWRIVNETASGKLSPESNGSKKVPKNLNILYYMIHGVNVR